MKLAILALSLVLSTPIVSLAQDASPGTFDGDPEVFARQIGPFEVTIERVATTSIRNAETTLQLSQEWDKTFAKSENVVHQKVTFQNRYGYKNHITNHKEQTQ